MSLSYKIFNDYKSFCEKNDIAKFFLKNQTRYMIWLLSVTRFENPIIKNFSFYYKNIPLEISSQININNQIDLALQMKYLEKKKSDIDKRSIIITSTKESDDVFEIYFKNIYKILS